jgi:hypothetical protein
MATKTDTTISLFSQKKLVGRAHTSNLKFDGEEEIGSNVQSSTEILFGEPVPDDPNLSLYVVQGIEDGPGTVEWITFELVPIDDSIYDATSPGGGAGSDPGESSQISGVHAYKFVLPSNYESVSSNSNAGGGIFDNGKVLYETLGKIQLVPPFYSNQRPNPYTVRLYRDNGSGGVGTQIPLFDNVDWSVDYYSGILFLQDYDATKIPKFARAFAYVGKMANTVISEAGGGGGGGTTYATNVLLQTSWMEQPVGEINGYNFTFDLAETPAPPEALLLYVNGVLQRGSGNDYAIADKRITMVFAPPDGSYIIATYPYLYYLPTSTQWLEVPSGIVNGVNYTFQLQHAPNPPSALMLYVNGVLQNQLVGGDFSISDKTITMNYPPEVGSVLQATYPY